MAMHNARVQPRGWAWLLLGTILALLAGCQPMQVLVMPIGHPPQHDPSYVVLIPSPDGSVGKVSVQGKDGQAQLLDQARQAAATDGQAIQARVGDAQLQRDFGAAMKARPQIPEHFLLYFTNDTTLTDESKAKIAKILQAARDRPVPDVAVIGHTDTLGSAAYNNKLALRRADAVAAMLRQAGLHAHSLTTESRGKRDLLVKTPDNTFEPKNRRVEVSVR